VRGAAEDEQPVYLRKSPRLHLLQWAGLLQPAEVLRNQPLSAQADGISSVPGRPTIQRASAPISILADVRCYVQLVYGAHEVARVVRLVRAQGNAPCMFRLLLLDHQQRSIALGVVIGGGHHHRCEQTVAVFNQHVAQIVGPRLLAVTLLVEPRIGIGRRRIRVAAVLLATEGATVLVVRSVLGAEILLRGPGLNQSSVHGEVFIAHELLRLAVYLSKEPQRHFGVQQPVTVLRKHRMVQDRIVHGQVHEPAEQEVTVDLLNQKPFGANREENMQQQGVQNVLGRNRRTIMTGIQGVQLGVERLQHLVGQLVNRPQRMIWRNSLFQ
jgi:hypothetical protein